jgi:hypothetical protein
MNRSELPASCTEGQTFVIKDGNAVDDCATGGGAFLVACRCDGGSSYTAAVRTSGQGLADVGAVNEMEFSYTDTLAANPGFAAEECVWTTDGSGGGGMICEGTAANNNEQLYLFPAADGADTTQFIAVDTTSITDLDGDGLEIATGVLGVDLIDDGDGQSATTASESGLEFVGAELGLIRGCSTGETLTWNDTNGDWSCAAGGGNSFGTIGSAVADSASDSMTVTDTLSIDFTTTDDPEDLSAAFDYTSTQAGNPALNAEETIFTTDGTGGGGLLFEGTVADTNEGLLQWNPTTDKILTLPDATDQLVGRDTTDTLTNKTLTTPTIGDFQNATHDHADAAGGGQVDIDDLSNQTTWATAATKTTAALTIDGVEVDYHSGTGNAYPRLLNDSTPDSADCDAAGEAGRMVFDTDLDTDGSVMVCTGAGGWKDIDDDGAAGGAPIGAQYVVGTADATLTNEKILTDGTGVDTVIAGGDAGSATINLDYSDTLAANPGFNAEECVFSTDGSGGGTFLCEGTTANDNEQLYLFPAVDGADTTDFIAVNSNQVTDLEGAGLSVTGGTLNADAAVLYDVNQASHGFSVGQVVNWNGTTWALADADNSLSVTGIVVAVADASNFTAAASGIHTITTHGFTLGTNYLSTTAGGLSNTDAGPGNIIQQVLHAVDANTVILQIGTPLT